MLLRKSVRALFRVVMATIAAVVVAAVARAVAGRLSGGPALTDRPDGTAPMSFDAWPPVPHAPKRGQG